MKQILMAVLVLLVVLDAVTTLWVLRLGGRELNPLLRVLIERFGSGAVAVTHVAIIVMVLALGPSTSSWMLAALAVAYLFVVANNVRAGLRQRALAKSSQFSGK